MRSHARVTPLRKSPTENPKDMIYRHNVIVYIEQVQPAETGYAQLELQEWITLLVSLGAQLGDLVKTHIASIFSALILIQAIRIWRKAMGSIRDLLA